MATFVTSKIKQVYHGFYANGHRRIPTKRPMYSVYQIVIDGVTKYIRTGASSLVEGTEVDLTTLSFFLCDVNGTPIVDNSGGNDSGGDTGGGTDPDPDPIDGGGDDDPDPIDGGGGDDSSGGNPVDPT